MPKKEKNTKKKTHFKFSQRQQNSINFFLYFVVDVKYNVNSFCLSLFLLTIIYIWLWFFAKSVIYNVLRNF